jgi:hypothetical protein
MIAHSWLILSHQHGEMPKSHRNVGGFPVLAAGRAG